MTSPGQPPSRNVIVAAGIAGVLLGVALCVAIVVVAFFFLMPFFYANTPCSASAPVGIVLIVLAAAMAALGWWAFRRKPRSFGGLLLKNVAVIAAIFFLAPWPCSFTGAAYFAFTGCMH